MYRFFDLIDTGQSIGIEGEQEETFTRCELGVFEWVCRVRERIAGVRTSGSETAVPSLEGTVIVFGAESLSERVFAAPIDDGVMTLGGTHYCFSFYNVL